MGKSNKKAQSKKNNNTQTIKRTIKFLSTSPDSDIVQLVLKKAPNGVIRAISNAALNASRGDVAIPHRYLEPFRHHHRHFDILSDNQVPLEQKRALLVQRGGFLPLVAPLIATVLGSIGGEFISRLFHKQNE